VLLVFDIGNKDSFLHLQKWEADMKKYGIEKNAVIVILGNKCDSKRRVSIDVGLIFMRIGSGR
jgi:GTPase SAR1 family protein